MSRGIPFPAPFVAAASAWRKTPNELIEIYVLWNSWNWTSGRSIKYRNGRNLYR
jgi:hypothetical protein